MNELKESHNDPDEQMLFTIQEIVESCAAIRAAQEENHDSVIDQFALLKGVPLSGKKPVPQVSTLENKSRWRPAAIPLATFSLLTLITIGILIYSLNATYRLNLEWEKRLNDKMQEAISLERVIKIFEKEGHDAGKSH